MKKKHILPLTLILFALVGCHDKYYHTTEPTGGAIFLYVLILCFFIPLVALGIAFLINGLIRLNKKPPRRNGAKFTTMGGFFLGGGLTLIALVSLLYFPNPVSIPNASKYDTPAKAMKAAVDYERCEFAVARDSVRYFYQDSDFVLRDAIMGVKDFKKTSDFRKVNQNCDSVHYYVQLNKNNVRDEFPFVQVSIFTNGNFFIDYVKTEDNGTVSYYYKMDETEATSIVECAYKIRSKYIDDRRQAEEAYNAQKREEGKIENFFKAAKQQDEISYSIIEKTSTSFFDGYTVVKTDFFKKDTFEILADFTYTQMSDSPLGQENRYLEIVKYNYPYDMLVPWQFSLYYTENGNYYFFLKYFYINVYGNDAFTTTFFSMTKSQGEGFYQVVKDMANNANA